MKQLCKIKIALSQGAKAPSYSSAQAAGADLCAYLPKGSFTLKSGTRAVVGTGLKIELPPGYEAQIRPRSGLSAKWGVTVLNSPGTVDSDYRGEVKVVLINHGKEDFVIQNGDRIAQMVVARHEVCEFEEVGELESTPRGGGGFGSTGIGAF